MCFIMIHMVPEPYHAHKEPCSGQNYSQRSESQENNKQKIFVTYIETVDKCIVNVYTIGVYQMRLDSIKLIHLG